MGLYGGSNTNTTTTTTTAPWEKAAPFAQTAVSLGTQLPGYWASMYPGFASGGGVSYSGPRLAEMSTDQATAMNQIRNASVNQTPAFQAGENWLYNTLGGSRTGAVAPEVAGAYYNAIQPTIQGNKVSPAAYGLSRAWSDVYDPAISGNYTNVIAPAVSEAWKQAYEPTIQGQYLDPSKNTALRSYAQAAMEPITQNYLTNVIPQLRSTANQAGMRGSDIEALYMNQAANDYMKQLGNTAAQIYSPAYESERNRQMAAAQYPSELWNQERQLQMQAAAFPSSIYLPERQLQMQAAQYPTNLYQYERNLEQAALPQATDYWNQLYTAAGNLSASGEEQQKYLQAQYDTQKQKFDENKWDLFNMVSALSNLAYTGGSVGGVSTQTSPTYYPGLASSLLGTGTGLAGLYGIYKTLGGG